MKIAVCTLGCKVNQFESAAMETELLNRGHSLAGMSDSPDAIIINTCAVTAESVRKSRQAVRRARRFSPNAIIAVCGCFSQTEPDAADNLDADIILGTGQHLGIIPMLEKFANDRRHIHRITDPKERRDFEVLPANGLAGRTRAMLKVQDGCDNYCAYCIIPYARGHARSLPMDIAVSDAVRLQNDGYLEVIITGIEISSYGKDLEQGNIADLIHAVCTAAPGLRVRLGSLEPNTITSDFCEKLKDLENLCPHFHLSLQSGCDDTLKRMGRKYDTARYFESVNLLRRHFTDCAITTDLIVGFPGETDAEFESTLEFIAHCGFASMHIFPYSKREGTAAAAMSGHLDKNTKTLRAQRARNTAQQMTLDWLTSCIGKVFPVLFETEDNGTFVGHTPNNALVEVRGTELKGKVISVLITGTDGEILLGELC